MEAQFISFLKKCVQEYSKHLYTMAPMGDAMPRRPFAISLPLSLALGVFATDSADSLLFFGEFPSSYWSHLILSCRELNCLSLHHSSIADMPQRRQCWDTMCTSQIPCKFRLNWSLREGLGLKSLPCLPPFPFPFFILFLLLSYWPLLETFLNEPLDANPCLRSISGKYNAGWYYDKILLYNS